MDSIVPLSSKVTNKAVIQTYFQTNATYSAKSSCVFSLIYNSRPIALATAALANLVVLNPHQVSEQNATKDVFEIAARNLAK